MNEVLFKALRFTADRPVLSTFSLFLFLYFLLLVFYLYLSLFYRQSNGQVKNMFGKE